jgi:hypothetical protein
MKEIDFSYRTMKISGIGSLFSAAISPTTSPQRATPVEEIRPTTPVYPQADAVVVSSRIKEQREQAESANADRASRREKVAEQVRSGTYKPDLPKVAESLVRDLM